MTLDQVIDLLTVAAVFDFRSIGEADAIAWHTVLGDLEFGDARAAVLAHYAESCDRVMPANIRQRVKAIRRDRLAREITPAPPPELADQPGRYKAELGAGIRRIADGRQVRLALAPPVREGPPPQAFTDARQALGPALPKRDPGPPGLQERALQQAAESRAARAAREVPGLDEGESA